MDEARDHRSDLRCGRDDDARLHARWLVHQQLGRALGVQKSAVAVIDALIPICVSQSKVDPDSMNKLEELVAIKSSYEQRDFVMKTGWATMPSADEPDRDLAAACADVLSKPAQS